jgi:hypothetical protein
MSAFGVPLFPGVPMQQPWYFCNAFLPMALPGLKGTRMVAAALAAHGCMH